MAVADVRGVRIALLVGMRMVLAVVGDPVEDGALQAHPAEYGPHVLQAVVGLEASVREQPVIPDRHPEAEECVGDDHDRQVRGIDPLVPEQHDGRQQPEERDDHADGA